MTSMLDGMATTRAIRRYLPDPIPDDDLNTMLFAASRAPTGSNRQGCRFIVLRDGPLAVQARALLGEGARDLWRGKASADGYDSGSGAVSASPKARMAATMAEFTDHGFEQAPVILLACLWLHREESLVIGGHVWPAVQNLLLAARRTGLRRGDHRVPRVARGRTARAVGHSGTRGGRDRRHHPARTTPGRTRTGTTPAPGRDRLRGRLGASGSVGGGPARRPLHVRRPTFRPAQVALRPHRSVEAFSGAC